MGQTQKLGRIATSVKTQNGTTNVQYHATIVVSFDADHITLDSGDWRTHTTKARMNQASNQYDLGYCVYQKDFEWFVEYDGKTLHFTDNMLLKR